MAVVLVPCWHYWHYVPSSRHSTSTKGKFSCRAGPRHDGRHDGPFVPCQPTARRSAAEGRKRRSPEPEEMKGGGGGGADDRGRRHAGGRRRGRRGGRRVAPSAAPTTAPWSSPTDALIAPPPSTAGASREKRGAEEEGRRRKRRWWPAGEVAASGLRLRAWSLRLQIGEWGLGRREAARVGSGCRCGWCG
jgi:hypothetical protein